MPEWMTILSLFLATARISILLADEDGPFELLEILRTAVGVQYSEHNYERYGKNNFAKGLICVWCNSFWLGLLITALYFFVPPAVLFYASLPFSLSMVSILIYEVTNGKG